MQEEKIIHIPLDQILEPSHAVRETIVLERLQELAQSVADRKVLLPLIVKPQGSKWEIIDGHRRYLASRMAGKVTAPCYIKDVKDIDEELDKIHANYFREDLTPLDEAKEFLRLHEKYNYNYNSIARLVRKSESYVVQRIQLLSADPAVMAALESRQISVSQAREIQKSPNERVRQELLRIVIDNGATVTALRMIRADYDVRAGVMTQEQAAQITDGDSTPLQKYLIECPCCRDKVDVNEIWPLSVCRRCNKGILAGVAEGEAREEVSK